MDTREREREGGRARGSARSSQSRVGIAEASWTMHGDDDDDDDDGREGQVGEAGRGEAMRHA